MKKINISFLAIVLTTLAACKKENYNSPTPALSSKSLSANLSAPDDWEQLPGAGNDISVGSKGTICITDNTVVSPALGYEVQKWNGTSWTTLSGGANRLAVDTAGNPWVVTNYHHIYKYTGNTTQLLPGAATDIGIGADGSVFMTDTTVVSATGGYRISKWNGSNWTIMTGAAGVRIAVDQTGKPWVVNKSNLIYRYNGSTWTQLPGQAFDIGIGADGTVYIVSTTSVSPTGGYRISKWNGTGWTATVSGAGVNMAVDPNGHPYTVNASHLIYRNLNL